MSVENVGFRSVGKIRKAHGIRGELFLISFSKSFDWLGDVDTAQLVKKEMDENGESQEVTHNFKIIKKKPHKIGYILKLEGFNNRNLAEEFEGSLFQVPESLFADSTGKEEFYLEQLKGFELLDPAGNLKGSVSGFSNNTVQDILVVSKEEESFEVPYVDQWIQQLDFANKKIIMNLPDGLEAQ
ncbi:MAG: ribosome maturation factor RimM [Bdellovibrionales bacterium]